MPNCSKPLTPANHCADFADSEISDLKASLSDIRAFLIPLWEDFAQEHGVHVGSEGYGMCRFTSAFLLQIMGPGWIWQGGLSNGHLDPQTRKWAGGDKPGGFLSRDGLWHDHFWIRKGDLIVDLTASQFGEDDVLITSAADSRYRHGLSAREKMESIRWVQDRAGQWADLYRLQDLNQLAPTLEYEPDGEPDFARFSDAMRHAGVDPVDQASERPRFR